MQRPELLVSFSYSCPPKLSVSITNNHLVHFVLITVEIDSLERVFRSHNPFLIIHNFVSEIFSLCNNTSLVLLKSIIAEDVGTYVHLSKYIKTVVNFRRNLLIHRAVLP